jgi:hypothetical protein
VPGQTLTWDDEERWPGDPVLATVMKGAKAPVELIVRTDWLATAVNRERLGEDMRRRIVDLACGHKAVTVNVKTCKCKACHAMILRGADYDKFRNRD